MKLLGEKCNINCVHQKKFFLRHLDTCFYEHGVKLLKYFINKSITI